MAERHRSKDGRKETEELPGEPLATDKKGRGGGLLARLLGTRDEQKRATERPAGATRVRKSDKREEE